jgi:YjbE family integral membrane protein
MFDFLDPEFIAIGQVIFIDLVLAGDNAIVVGMAAAGVAPEYRKKVIFYGIMLAVVLRIAFAAATMQLLGVIGLTLAGGILLLWVSWKLYRELKEQAAEDIGAALVDEVTGDGVPIVDGPPRKSMRSAVLQVLVADVSMSLDNVLAVAGVAKDHMSALVIGLSLSVILMGIGAGLIARLLQRHHWIGYLGLLMIGYVAISMIWRGGSEVMAYAGV